MKTGKKWMNEGQEKARFLTVWRQKKTDLDLRTSIKGYSVTLALNHALDMADYIKTEEVSNNENRKLVKNWAIVHRISYSNITTPKQSDFAWHENLPSAAIVSVLCAS